MRIGGAAGPPGTGKWRLALPLFALADVLTWLVLRRTDRFVFGWRVLIDAFDCSFWSLSPHPRNHFFDASVLISIPLAIEAGFRIGVLALAVPVIELSVTGPLRAVAGRAVHPFTFAWLLIGIGLGMALSATADCCTTRPCAQGPLGHSRQWMQSLPGLLWVKNWFCCHTSESQKRFWSARSNPGKP